MAEIYWIATPGPGRVALMPCPRGGDGLKDEIRALRQGEKVDVLVSLLEAAETWELELADEARLAEAAGMEFVSHPIPDHSVPASVPGTRAVAVRLAERVKKGRRVAVHCRAGIGRSALVAGCVLLETGVALGAVLERLAAARGFAVPETPEQLAWLGRYASR